MTRGFEALVDVLTSDRDPARWAALFAPGARLVDRASTGPDADASEWLAATLARTPCVTFSCEWRMTDGAAGAAWMWCHLPDPDEADINYDAPCLWVASARRDGLLTGVELFGPFGTWDETVADWEGAVGETKPPPPDPGLRPHAPSHPPLPSPAPDRAILEAVADALVTENWLDLVAWGARWHDHAGHPIERWADGRRCERTRVLGGARAVVLLDHELPAAIVVHVDETGRLTFLDHLCDWSTATEPQEA
ncbi:MAG: hypothetical protein AB7Q42_23695 [Acidimicrobiia bacterium]